jgi:L-ascorbate metabolism protein UlaG (beta-lactamase superfamily)
MPTLKATLIGGPTAVLEYGGVRWLTDPALSAPGEYDHLTKTTGPALDVADFEPIDAVLLSHDQHADNLDPAGREVLPRAGTVLTTTEGAQRLGGNAVGLAPWETTTVGEVTVTAVPARHGPYGCEPVTGPVTGFVLAADGAEPVYVSGDNASVDVVREIARRLGPLPIAVLFCGAVQIPVRFDGAYLTLSADHAAEAAQALGARAVVPVHFEGWGHFTQGADALRAAFAGNGISDRLVVAERGATVSV